MATHGVAGGEDIHELIPWTNNTSRFQSNLMVLLNPTTIPAASSGAEPVPGSKPSATALAEASRAGSRTKPASEPLARVKALAEPRT